MLNRLIIAVGLLIASMFPAFAVDITVTASSVQIVTNASDGKNTLVVHGTAGTTINAGMVVYLDANGIWQPADATTTAKGATAARLGIAMNTAALNQAISVAVSGHVTLTNLVKASPAFLSPTANGGNITVTLTDITSGKFLIHLGMATSTTDLLLNIVNCACTV